MKELVGSGQLANSVISPTNKVFSMNSIFFELKTVGAHSQFVVESRVRESTKRNRRCVAHQWRALVQGNDYGHPTPRRASEATALHLSRLPGRRVVRATALGARALRP